MNDAVHAAPGLAPVTTDALTNFDPSPSSDEDPSDHQWHYSGARRADAPVGRIGA